jgi:hypothetical protein
MGEVNMTEAFGRYKVKPSHGGRSAVMPNGALVVSCYYARFKRAQPEVLRYEEDLAEETNSATNNLRTHLAAALEKESDVRVVIAVVENRAPSNDPSRVERPLKTTFHARKDLLGRVTFFDGKRFVIDFKKTEDADE